MNRPLSAHQVGIVSNCIYVMTAGTRHVKVGVSIDVEERVKAVQTGCPFKVQIARQWVSRDAYKIERLAHMALAKYRKAGEWFDVPSKAAIEIVDWLIVSHP